ncbi:putative phospholipid:diacylglycerol acyltransferase 2 [Acorus calamus]|uniref:Phospholipid:diacylglycerol acyltransferase 2 n=1 Tax=Acorus calamus TaxID=4465 RepID=A0AAV9DF37_ACOCL|nr:putative phospholipid:diacylglycerol acyltransferase 2 [Acorus calamus]
MGPPFLRLRKLYAVVHPKIKYEAPPPISEDHRRHHHQQQHWLKKTNHNTDPNGWRCVDRCCWMIGYTCTVWWVALLLYGSLLHADVTPDQSPGSRLRREGLGPLHPVIMVPGIANGGLELWEGRPCSEGLFRKRIWGGNFAEIFKRPRCWLEHMSLDNETGLDPEGIRVRAVPGLVAADYFTPGYFVWAILIKNLARIGYEGKNMHMTAYDWRLSFQNTEVTVIPNFVYGSLKSKIELMVRSNGNKKVVVVPHSMGVLYFLHFLKWVEAPPPLGGGGGSQWCAKHIKAIMNISPTFLGVPKAVSGIFSAEAKDIAFARAMAPGILDSGILGLRALEHIMRVSQTWDSIISLLPKGGETIWGNLDWSPEQGYPCDPTKKRFLKSSLTDKFGLANSSDHGKLGLGAEETVHYGRIISFGKMASELPSSKLSMINYKDFPIDNPTQGRSSSEQVWTEYNEMNFDSIRTIVENKVYTTKTILDLFRSVAPKLMRRADAHFSHGIADDLDDPKYSHYKYWSNPLETK